MKRRHFLKATLASAGALILGCGDDGDTNGTGTGTGTGTGDTANPDGTAGEDILDGAAFFPQSVASGDPRATSVILWTRLVDGGLSGQDGQVDLQVAMDEAFTQLVSFDGQDRMTVTAQAAFDHCVKVRLTDLAPATTYYYRFLYTQSDMLYGTRTGRTKTAPTADADVPVRFAYLSCQDFNGRYYNTLAQLATEELDFVVHLGDYVYETTGNPIFQDIVEGRRVQLTDTAGAIALGSGEQTYEAAASLSNYRELYQIYRGDVDLQRIHELFPMIAIWDDHEYSNDCYGATATYFAGRQDETDVARRQAANQAWFEYMPVDYADPAFTYDPSATYPDDITIYRDFGFGKHLHLVMTDLRTYRSPHLIDAGSFPGTVILTEEELMATLGEVPAAAGPYVDIDTYQGGLYKQALADNATALDIDAAAVQGNVSVTYVNGLITALNEATGQAPIDLIDEPGAQRGFAFLHLGKRSNYTDFGARSLVAKQVFDLYSAKRFQESGGDSELGMGAAQEAWFLSTMQGSSATWKVWGTEYCLIPMQVDLRGFGDLPDDFKQVFYINVDDWNGQRNRRSQLLEQLSQLDNVVAITGDIHSFYAGTPWVNDDPSKKIVELVGGAVSSATLRTILIRAANSDETLKEAGAVALAGFIGSLMTNKSIKPNPHMGYALVDHHGYVVVDVTADALEATYRMIPEAEIGARVPDAELEGKFGTERFRVDAGAPELFREIDGAWKRWDPETYDWV